MGICIICWQFFESSRNRRNYSVCNSFISFSQFTPWLEHAHSPTWSIFRYKQRGTHGWRGVSICKRRVSIIEGGQYMGDRHRSIKDSVQECSVVLEIENIVFTSISFLVLRFCDIVWQIHHARTQFSTFYVFRLSVSHRVGQTSCWFCLRHISRNWPKKYF